MPVVETEIIYFYKDLGAVLSSLKMLRNGNARYVDILFFFFPVSVVLKVWLLDRQCHLGILRHETSPTPSAHISTESETPDGECFHNNNKNAQQFEHCLY